MRGRGVAFLTARFSSMASATRLGFVRSCSILGLRTCLDGCQRAPAMRSCPTYPPSRGWPSGYGGEGEGAGWQALLDMRDVFPFSHWCFRVIIWCTLSVPAQPYTPLQPFPPLTHYLNARPARMSTGSCVPPPNPEPTVPPNSSTFIRMSQWDAVRSMNPAAVRGDLVYDCFAPPPPPEDVGGRAAAREMHQQQVRAHSSHCPHVTINLFLLWRQNLGSWLPKRSPPVFKADFTIRIPGPLFAAAPSNLGQRRLLFFANLKVSTFGISLEAHPFGLLITRTPMSGPVSTQTATDPLPNEARAAALREAFGSQTMIAASASATAPRRCGRRRWPRG